MGLSIELGLLLLFITFGSCEDTVADDIGIHMLLRISEYLTAEQCQDLHKRLIGPDDDPLKKFEELPPDDQEKIRKRREIVSRKECFKVLKEWMETKGDTVYWDRFYNILFTVGRADIAKELGKNLMQDKMLAIEIYVKGYHESMKKLKASMRAQGEDYYVEKRKRDLNNLDEHMDLIIEREQLPPYNRSLTEWCWPLLYGLMIGASGYAVVAILMVQFIFRFIGFENVDNNLNVKIKEFPGKNPARYSSDEDSDIEKEPYVK